jgi:hypothetical protein
MSGTKEYHLLCDIDETLVQYKWGRKPQPLTDTIRGVMGSAPNTQAAWYGLPATELAKYDIVGPYVLRPGLRELMAFAFANFATVSILTRATRDYAEELQERLLAAGVIPRPFDNIWARRASSLSTTYKRRNHSKNLEYVWSVLDKSGRMNRRNTVFIDDLHENTHNPSNEGNSIRLPPFAPFGYEYEPTPYRPMHHDPTLHTLIGKLRRILNGDVSLPFRAPQRITRRYLARVPKSRTR